MGMSEAQLKEYKKIFDDFDDKKKGFLSKRDTFDAVRCCGLNPSEDQLKQAVSVCKISGPNKITFKEFSAMVVEIDASDCPDERKMRESLFKMDSHMGGGFIDVQEMSHILKTRGEGLKQSELDMLLTGIELQGGQANIEGTSAVLKSVLKYGLLTQFLYYINV